MTTKKTTKSSATKPAAKAKKSKAEERLETRVAELEAELAQHTDGWQRARADYQNLKREWETRQGRFMVDAKRQLLLELLPVYDHLKQAIAQQPKATGAEAWVTGIKYIADQFAALLKTWKVEEIPTVGHKFDPAVHEAVESNSASGAMVVREVAGGYKIDRELVRPARVVVGDHPPDSTASATR